MTLSPFIFGLPIYLVGFNYIVLSHAFWVLSRLFFSLVIGYSYNQVFILQFYSSEIISFYCKKIIIAADVKKTKMSFWVWTIFLSNDII